MEALDKAEVNREYLLTLTADIVAAYVGNNSVRASEIPGLINDVYSAFASAEGDIEDAPQQADKPKPAVNPKKSITDDYLICLEDGKKFKSLKRHLMTHYGLTPEQYREKWGLEPNYPMVSPNYAKARSNLAKKMGLGRKAKED